MPTAQSAQNYHIVQKIRRQKSIDKKSTQTQNIISPVAPQEFFLLMACERSVSSVVLGQGQQPPHHSKMISDAPEVQQLYIPWYQGTFSNNREQHTCKHCRQSHHSQLTDLQTWEGSGDRTGSGPFVKKS